VKTNNSLNLVALAKNMPAGSDVELLLDAAGCADPVQSSTGVFTTQCTNLVRGDHILTAAINASGMEVAADLNDAVGTSGNYFIAVGDSITNGRGDNCAFDNISLDERIVAMQGFEAPLADQLSASGLNPVIIFNEGIGGDESYDAAYTRISSILARHPGSNKVLLMLGTNDSGVPVLSGLGCSGTSCNGTYKQNMQNLINSIRALGKTVYVALVPPAFTTATPLGSSRNNLIQQYNTVIKTELTDIQVQRPDFFSYFLTSSVNRFSLFEDDLHTNALGYLAMTHLWHNALTGTTTLPFILDDLTPSTVSPYLKQNLLEVEDLYYVDETFTLTAIPPALGAGRWVMTANSGKTNTSAEYLSFSVAGNVTVYIAYDANAASPPNWLKNDFTATGTQLTTTNPAAPQMKLYASNTARTGTISLGGNLATGAIGAQANYIVIVVQN
jgi:lysophospholipase L1-like esterase